MGQPLSAEVGTTSPTSGGRSASIIHSLTKATEFSLVLVFTWHYIPEDRTLLFIKRSGTGMKNIFASCSCIFQMPLY
jgi:hypothetical protein